MADRNANPLTDLIVPGYVVLLLVLFGGFAFEAEGVELPPGFWPVLATIAAFLGLITAFLVHRRKTNLAESAKTVTVNKSEWQRIGQIQRSLAQQNAQLHQQVGHFRKLALEKFHQTADAVYQRCLEIQSAKPEARLVQKLPVPFRKEFSQRHNHGSGCLERVRLQDFVQLLPSHQQWCRDHGLILSEYLRTMPLAEAVDALRLDILRHHLAQTSFCSDQEVYDIADYWEPSIYFWYLKRGDCESHTTTLQALFLAAGLDGPLEMLTWNSCGTTFRGAGHSTIYAYSLGSQRWHHLESLGPLTVSGLSDLPPMYDDSDASNLENFTLSFNSQMTRIGPPEELSKPQPTGA